MINREQSEMLVHPVKVGIREYLLLYSLIQKPPPSPLLVVEVVDVLHVAKDNLLLVGDAWRNFFHPIGHLPQVRLTGRGTERGVSR